MALKKDLPNSLAVSFHLAELSAVSDKLKQALAATAGLPGATSVAPLTTPNPLAFLTPLRRNRLRARLTHMLAGWLYPPGESGAWLVKGGQPLGCHSLPLPEAMQAATRLEAYLCRFLRDPALQHTMAAVYAGGSPAASFAHWEQGELAMHAARKAFRSYYQLPPLLSQGVLATCRKLPAPPCPQCGPLPLTEKPGRAQFWSAVQTVGKAEAHLVYPNYQICPTCKDTNELPGAPERETVLLLPVSLTDPAWYLALKREGGEFTGDVVPIRADQTDF
jgi:hypothetical protein